MLSVFSKGENVQSDIHSKLNFLTDFRYVFGLSCIFLCAVILFFLGVKSFNYFLPSHSYLVLVPSFLIAFLGVGYKSSYMPTSLKFIFYLCVFVPLFYGITSYLSYQPQNEFEVTQLKYMNWVLMASGVFAVGSIFRPFLAMVTLTYLPWRDLMAMKIVGVMINDRVDWIVLVEMGIFILLCTACLKISELVFSKETLYGKGRGDKLNAVKPMESVYIVAICLHLANYFFSGFQKLILDGGPLAWPFENATYEFSAYAYERGLFPLAGFSENTFSLIYHAMEFLTVPMNLAVLTAQIIALFAFSHKRLLIGLTLFYDAMHIAIFFTTGIFFWKWILLNLVIVASLTYWKHNKISLSFNLAAMGFILMSVFVFSIARLGWYDTHASTMTHVYAHYKDGRKIEVPTNYFLTYSFRFIFSYDHLTAGGFQDNLWGQGVSSEGAYNTLVQSKTCSLPLTGQSTDPDHPRRGLNVLINVLRNHHKYVLNHVDENGIINYNFYPHHVWSSIGGFEDFYNSDKRDIIGFEIVNQSMCFHFDDEGHYAPIIKHEGSTYVSVANY